MASVESRIDELYQGKAADFVAARNALAKTLTGEEAKRVKSLVKPTVVPWSVNQVYWHARDVFQRVIKAGEKVRQAQLAALKGRAADVRDATTAHRQAIGEAVKTASRLAADEGVHADPEPLSRMFEALSLQPQLPETAGRFTKVLQPQGFEALAGVTIQPPAVSDSDQGGARHRHAHGAGGQAAASSAAKRISDEEAKRREREAASAARRKEAAIKKAEAVVERAQAAVAQARDAWTRAKKELEDAERHLRDVQFSD